MGLTSMFEKAAKGAHDVEDVGDAEKGVAHGLEAGGEGLGEEAGRGRPRGPGEGPGGGGGGFAKTLTALTGFATLGLEALAAGYAYEKFTEDGVMPGCDKDGNDQGHPGSMLPENFWKWYCGLTYGGLAVIFVIILCMGALFFTFLKDKTAKKNLETAKLYMENKNTTPPIDGGGGGKKKKKKPIMINGNKVQMTTLLISGGILFVVYHLYQKYQRIQEKKEELEKIKKKNY